MKERCKENTGQKGLLIVISGPSGVGKGTICSKLFKRDDDIRYSVSATTRMPRPGETHGRDYWFYAVEEFMELVKRDAFLEWAKVYDNYYGTPRSAVEEVLAEGKDCILEIDVQGALQVKKKMPESVFIFIVPPSKEELTRRITGRGTESGAEIGKRLQQADGEIAYLHDYDHVVVNDRIDQAVERIRRIIEMERTNKNKGIKDINIIK